jgi:hypothetical protein
MSLLLLFISHHPILYIVCVRARVVCESVSKREQEKMCESVSEGKKENKRICVSLGLGLGLGLGLKFNAAAA